MARFLLALLVCGLGLALAQPSDNNGAYNGQFNFGDNNGGTNGNSNTGGGGNGNGNGNVNAGAGNGNVNGNGNAGAGNGVFNGNYNLGAGNGGANGNNNLGSFNGGNNGNSNTGNNNGGQNGNSNTGNNNGGSNGNFNFGSGNGVSNGNGNVGSGNGNGNGNNNGKGNGDPVFTDFVGRTFEFFGAPGKFYTILSEKHHSLSTLMKFGQMYDHNGTYMEGFGFQYRAHKVVAAITRDDTLLVSINGKPLVMRSGEVEMQHVLEAGQGRTLTVDWQVNRPGMGNAVEISTEFLKLTIWLTEAGTRDAGGLVQPSYLNFDLSMLSAPTDNVMTGIVGETYERLVAGEEAVKAPTHPLYLPDDSTFRGHALSDDYEQRGYFDNAHRFNLHAQDAEGSDAEDRAHGRRLAESGNAVSFPAKATGRNVVEPKEGAATAPVKLVLNRRLLRA